MRETPKRDQLAMEWTDAVQWDELPEAAHVELRPLLRELLRQAAHDDAQAEGAHGE
jgi:hypothetical protein